MVGAVVHLLIRLVAKSAPDVSAPFLHFLSFPPSPKVLDLSSNFNATLFKSLHMPSLHDFL